MGATNKNFSVRLDYRVIIGALVVIILGMLAFWRPWEAKYGSNARTIEVTGKATLTAAPDLFVFYPTYEFPNADKQAALAALTKKSNEVVSKLKALGVADSKIKTNADSYDYPGPMYPDKTGASTFTLRLTVTVNDKNLAQKVQDYLNTTSASGAITAQASFSNKKQTELEGQARDQATKDARSKAEQSANNLGFKLGSVKTVTDGPGFGVGVYSTTVDGSAAPTSIEQMPLQPGENELNYTVTVTYFLR
jgi:uncharacterized protein YggE